MFYKISRSARELEASLIEKLPSSEEDVGVHKALQSLAETANLFEQLDLPDEAEVLTQVLETIASGQFDMVKEAKKKSKKKSKKKTKKSKKPTKVEEIIEELTPEKEVENLKEVGWVFNDPTTDNCNECLMVADDGQKEEPAAEESCGDCGCDHMREPQKAFELHFPVKLE